MNEIKTTIQQIADVLLLNGGFLKNQGLYSGEMSLVLFFARYARFTQNNQYLEYSYGLTHKIQDRIHRDTPISYKEGLSGIGSAIEYLVQNGFFVADTDDVLEDFDKRIFFTYNLLALFPEELMDIGYYAVWRLSGSSKNKDKIRTVLSQIVKACNKYDVGNYPAISFFGDLEKDKDLIITPAWYQLCKKIMTNSLVERTYLHCRELITKNVFWNTSVGYQNRLAGWGLNLLTELDGDDSWISLFPNDFILKENESLSV